MRARFRVLTAAVVLIAAAGATVDASARGTATRAGALTVLGFQSEGSSPRLIDRSAHAMTLVGVDGVDLTGPGQISAPDSAARRQLARGHADGLPAVLLVDNWSDKVNDFYEPLAYETLGRPADSDRAASALARDVIRGHWNGVSVDLESLAPRDRPGLTRFVGDLRNDLPRADSLTVCLTAVTSVSGYRANGYDLAGLAAQADQIVLMSYDDHGPWENIPGPIGPLRW
jgi:spore germination protein